MGKKFLFLITIFFNFSLIFSATNFYQEYTTQIPWKYEIYETTDNSYSELKNPNPYFYDGDSGSSNIGEITYDIKTGAYGRFFIFPANNNDYVLKKGKVVLLQGNDCNLYSSCISQTSNFTKYTATELKTPTSKCVINFDGENITSNLKPLSGGGNLILNANQVIPHLLEKYYFINTSAKFFLANGSVKKIDIFVGDVPVNLSEIYEGDYLAAEFLPQDLKCDFGGIDGILDSNEIQGVFVNNSLDNINDYFNNTINFSVSNVRQINILNDTLKADINYSNGGKNVSVNFSRLKKSGGKNVSVYFLLNKNSWGDLSVENISDLRADFKTNFPLSNEFDFFVVDKDPIIGYHFDILPDNINVGFNGTIDGVLIESDAVVYSGSKDFVFNYRSSGGNCDEKLVNSGGKNICINFFVE